MSVHQPCARAVEAIVIPWLDTGWRLQGRSVVALAACDVPARRDADADPMLVLREE
jgi:hypothetical protein